MEVDRRAMAKKIVKNFMLDQELVDELMRKSAARREPMSLVVREALRAYLQIGAN